MCCISKKKGGGHYITIAKTNIVFSNYVKNKFCIHPKEFKTQNLQHDTTLKSNRK